MAEAVKNGDFLRRPPASVEAEQAVLSAIITNNKAFERVSDFLRPAHFSEALHGRIYAAATALIEKGHLADIITLKNYLELQGGFEKEQADYLATLASSAVSVVNAEDYGKLVFDLAQKRSLIDLGTEIVNNAFGDQKDSGSQIDEAEQRLYDLSARGADSRMLGFDAALRDSLGIIEKAYKNDGHLTGVSTGFDALDKKLGGLQPSDLIVIAGRPGMGKTALGLNIAFNVANEVMNGRHPDKLKGPVAFFSLEMSSDQLTSRVLSFTAEVSSHNMMKGTITESDFQKISEYSRQLTSLPLFIDDTPGISVSSIRARARRLKQQNGGLSLIVVDYVQLIEAALGPRRDGNRVQEVSEITRGLKILAKELDVPVIALSQLSRGVESRDDKRPLLADLRESGSIEQDADIVMFVYREAYYLERQDPKDVNSDAWIKWKTEMDKVRNKAELIIAKQRRGPTGLAELSFIGEFTKFGNFYNG